MINIFYTKGEERGARDKKKAAFSAACEEE